MSKVLLYFLVLAIFPVAVYAGSVTLTTYYPSPTGNYDRLSASNISIGTTTDNAMRLTVKNDTGLGNGEHFIADFVRTGFSEAQLLIGYRGDGTSATSTLLRSGNNLPITFGTSGSTQAMTILNNGNVGIGNPVPGASLDVVSGGPQAIFRRDAGANGLRINQSAANGQVEILNQANQSLVLGTNNTARVTIDNNGNVGLGAAPAALFDVSGASILRGQTRVVAAGAPVNAAGALSVQSNTATTAIEILNSGGAGAGGAVRMNNNSLDLVNAQNGNITAIIGGTDRLHINNNGEVGLGITNPEGYLADANALVLGATAGGNRGLTVVTPNTQSGSVCFADGTASPANCMGRVLYSHPANSLQFYTNGNNNRMEILSDGNVGIGITPTARLHVSGDALVTGSITANGHFYPSDQRLKTNIVPIPHPLSTLQQINGVSFNWKKDGHKDIGLTAQDIEKVLPELVATDKQGMKSVKYGNLVGLLVEAVKEQQQQISTLQHEIDNLRSQIKKD